MENNPIFDIPNPDEEYHTSSLTKCTGFTLLMKLAINACQEGVMDYLNRYISTLTKEEIDKKNNIGWTALMLACRNHNTLSNFETICMLLKYGANPNLKDSF